MHTSANLSVSSPSVPVPSIPANRGFILRAAIAAILTHVAQAGAAVRRAAVGRRRRSSWSKDLPWDVGMDRLAEQAFPSWIPRG